MKKLTYDSAYKELSKIFEKIEQDAIPLEALGKNVARANELVQFCKTRLRDIESEVDGLMEEE